MIRRSDKICETITKGERYTYRLIRIYILGFKVYESTVEVPDASPATN